MAFIVVRAADSGGIRVFGDVSLNQTDIVHRRFFELILVALAE
jgi:hypothetical protein